jgi:heat shock protein HslJ
MRALALTLTMAIAAAGCATTQTAAVSAPTPRPLRAPPGPPPPTLDGVWNLALVRDAPQGVRLAATLKIEADRAEGSTECRAWTARAPNVGMDLRFDRLTAREQACSDQIRAAERRYLDALAKVRTVQMRSGYLVLIDERGRDQLYFARGG